MTDEKIQADQQDWRYLGNDHDGEEHVHATWLEVMGGSVAEPQRSIHTGTVLPTRAPDGARIWPW